MKTKGTVLVTGVAGFIGSNFAEELLEAGYGVTGVDNFSYGFERNIAKLRTYPGFRFVEGDVRSEALWKELSGDIIVHLASQKIPRYSNAYQTLDDNMRMLKNVTERCKEDKVKLVFASTSDVYGKNPNLPYSETSDMLIGPTTVKRWAYSVSKIYGEQYIIANHDEFALDYTIVRFFGSYGPHQNLTWWGGPQSVFIDRALKKEAIEIHGDGMQTRTFTFVKDTVQGLVKATLEEQARNEIFNIASEPDEEITILELAKKIWRLINGPESAPLIQFIPYSTFGNYEDVMRRVPDISKIKTRLGFQPLYSIDTGMKLTIDWQTSVEQ